ncbi:dipeptidyl peptidase 9 isoform X3 [Spodoptera litura]|uniref:Dipeptidyl peptidase 9 isoform X3 n=1 Tax=Spodoptera litura TaxID=69820 RepID=A0A9J7DYI0_SPOLT|nr:dipeptidyl peptidase 9 isoform X3 [Spodoptera litura]
MEINIMEVRGAGDGAAAVDYVRPPSKRYTWAEVRQAVHDLRKELSCLSTMVPIAISFRKLANGKIRIYFLRTPQNGWEITLLYTDVSPTQQANNSRLDWKPLIESNVALGVSSGKWSREEQLLWERQRVAAWGIASYELHQTSGKIMFPCASSLFVADEGSTQSPPLVPRCLNTGGGAPLTPAMCPRTPELVAHAARGDIWLAGGQLRRPTRLTYACKGHEPDRLADDPRQAGVPCYVTQEEFSRYTGFWWQPQAEDDIYRIVYEEVDESEVKIYCFPSSQSTSGEVEEFRFPRAGTPNAKSSLKMLTFRLQKATSSTVLDYYHEGASEHLGDTSNGCMEVVDLRWYELKQPLKECFPWFEYLARVGWTPDGQYVWAQLLDRKQQRLELVLIPLSQFCAPAHYDMAGAVSARHEPSTSYEQPIQDIQILVSETAPDAWINVHDILYFLPSSGNEMNFIWASEESGHLHLYLVTCALIQRSHGQKRTVIEMINEDESNAVGPNMISKEPITAGEWEVMSRKIWVDTVRQLVYFVGLRETPLERHLYVAPLSPPRPHAVLLLTPVGHSCTVDIDEECSTAVITSSNITTAPVTRVYRILHTPPRLLVQGSITERAPSECTEVRSLNGSWDSRDGEEDTDSETGSLIRERSLSLSDIPPPQIFETRLSCGATAYCTLWRCGRAGRSPTVLHVYGGPEVQTVTNSYKGIRQLRMHMLAARGFNVVAVDSRGSKHRGRAWEAAIKGKLGQIELDDQVEVLQWLAKETGCIDMERVAIHGWSYGGYLSLLGLATRPGIFRACVAGAPVTCWRLYDTAYTERYMGPPSRSPHAYTRASVLAHAPFFPDQEGRLLIIHGLADENVHFCHTAALTAELVRLGKPHRVQVYPGERHSLRAMHAAKHYEATLLHFLHENL